MNFLRPWATPLTIATTVVTIVTGVLLFFHLAPGLTKLSHEWIGMAMVAAVVVHLILNWRPFKAYFKRPVGLALIGLGVVVTALTFAISPQVQGPGGNPMMVVMRSLEGAEIQQIAALGSRDIDSVLAALADNGYSAQPDQTLRDVANGERGKQAAILNVILAE